MKAILFAATLLFTISSRSQPRESFTIYFDFDRHQLTKEAARAIDSMLASNKKEDNRVELEVMGHCDSRGTNDYNNLLSEKRARTVQHYLIKKGINIESFLAVIGAGELQPLNENSTDEERRLNRRVEITIIKKNKNEVNGNKTLNEKIADSTTTAGTSIVLRDINFEGGRRQPLPGSIPAMKELLAVMKAYPKLVIEINGNICCEEGDQDGIDTDTGLRNLSTMRAKRIADWLVYMGIDSNRVSYKGLGHSNPIYPYPEKTEEERIQNRRVEIKIISK